MAEEKKNEVSAEAEPWEGWEAGLVRWSIIAGLIALVILGALVNIFIL
ncbi:MAG TPA: hypothetical protein G4O01_05970 [Dehalococcoidia bacterium]|jgi:cytochrome b561|nr:hypothetical protein [Dehalococcoidia bacterium]